jgi:ABC-2 type transport system ATP-binding protein
MTPAVEIEGLEKTFGGTVRALDGISLEVESGTIFGLLGPNGAGKTTAIRILTTVLRQDKGTAHVLGFDTLTSAKEVRKRIGLAGQFAAVDENLTGAENLWMVGRLNHMSKADVRDRSQELLGQFDLVHAADRPLKTYSGGMRRRLDVAAALLARPRVLFLDEPTTGLDPASRVGVWEMIEHLVAGGTTVLLTTQYLEEADRLCDKLVVIDHGRVIAEGTPTSLKAQLGATVLELGLADDETARKAGEALRGIAGKDPIIDGNVVDVNVDEGPRIVGEALRILEAQGLVLTSLALREPSLDDVFLALTGQRTEGDGDDGGDSGATATERSRRRRRARGRATEGAAS